MAEGGSKRSETLKLGSDDLPEYLCSPCTKDNKTVAATKYCVECGDNLCATCLSYHDKFVRGHQVTEKLRSDAGQKRPDLPLERCDKHGGKLVDEYCPDHDVVGCSTCMNTVHSLCRKIQFVPDAAEWNRDSSDTQDLEKKMTELLKQLETLKGKNEALLNKLKHQRDLILNQIRELRKKINKRLDEMEEALVQQVDSFFEEKTAKETTTGKEADEIMSSLDNSHRKLREAKYLNEAELFVQQKLGKASFRKYQDLTETLKSFGDGHWIKLADSDEIKHFLDGQIQLCKLHEILVPQSISHVSDINVSWESDKEVCNISNIILTSNDNLILVDQANKCLKKLSASLSITEHLNLLDEPLGVCEVDKGELALTLDNKTVQFVSVSEKQFMLLRSFSVGESCYGIAFNNGHIYVCCYNAFKDDGSTEEDLDKLQGYINVYTIEGQLLTRYYMGLKMPMTVTKSRLNNNVLLVTDLLSQNIFSINMHNNHISAVMISNINAPSGYCIIGNSQLCVAGFRSNNILLVSKDGENQQVILTKKDGILKPLAVCFDEKRYRLLVCFENCDKVKVFHIKM